MTTLIIDRKEGLVLSDSRGTQENEISNWKLIPFPRLERTISEDYLTIQKIYEFNNHVIVGCGSLELLEKFAHKIRFFNFTFKDTYYHKCEFDLDNTTVYINKRTFGNVHTLELKIKPTKIGFGWYKLKVSKAVMKKRYTFNGSGKEIALGAYEAGKDLFEAIKIAAKYDNYTDSNIQEARL